jgi:hypothetical protein
MVIALLLGLALPVLAENTPPGKQIDTLTFFQSIQGNYTIDLAGGQAPQSDDNSGQVSPDSNQSLVQMPYCVSGGACYLGYNYFPTATTAVYDSSDSDGETFTLMVTAGNTTKKYEWVTTGGKTLFRNYQFQEGNQTITLEYQVTKD